MRSRARHPRRQLALTFLLIVGCSRDSRCDPCGIELEEAVTLEDAGYTMSPRLVRTSDGGFAAIGTYDPERVVRLDSSGKVIRAAGRKGNGPGEFQRLRGITVGTGDTLFVTDGSRVHVLDPDLSWVRTVGAPLDPADLVVLPDGAIVGHAAGSRAGGEPSLFEFRQDSPLRVSWFDYRSDGDPMSVWRAISHHGGEIWSVGRLTLGVAVFDHAGNPLREFRIEHPWFDRDEPDPAIRVEDVVHAMDGHLLVLVARVREDWEPPRAGHPGEARPVALSTAQFVDRWEQQILLVDRMGNVIRRSGSTADLGLLGFADAGHVYGYRGDEEGSLRVWRVRLAELPMEPAGLTP